MTMAARAAVNAAKRELKIESPSKVFRDEVGRMTMKGWGLGVSLESREQAKVVANAARYLTNAAKESSVAYASNDNRKTYNQSSTVTVNANVRNETDAKVLAAQLAGTNRRIQAGYGTT